MLTYLKNQELLVSWSSRLWHLLNTQNVPSSILGEIKNSLFFLALFECTLQLTLRVPNRRRHHTTLFLTCEVVYMSLDEAVSVYPFYLNFMFILTLHVFRYQPKTIFTTLDDMSSRDKQSRSSPRMQAEDF